MNANHAGDAGDVIYSLPVPLRLGAERLILHERTALDIGLQPRVGISRDYCRFLAPLIEAQGLMVDWRPGRITTAMDLNWFRLHWRGVYDRVYTKAGWKPPISLQRMHLAAFGVLDLDETKPWLSAAPDPVARIIVARSPRYHNAAFPWREIVYYHHQEMAFVGLTDEWNAFCNEFGYVPRVEVRNALELASVIAGSELFIGNQSMPCAVAEGLKHPLIQETRAKPLEGADCMFARPNVVYVVKGNEIDPETLCIKQTSSASGCTTTNGLGTTGRESVNTTSQPHRTSSSERAHSEVHSSMSVPATAISPGWRSNGALTTSMS
jgi:hypothetical protein